MVKPGGIANSASSSKLEAVAARPLRILTVAEPAECVVRVGKSSPEWAATRLRSVFN